MTKADRNWAIAHDNLATAQKAELAAVKRALPKGRFVEWEHGTHVRSGWIEWVADHWWVSPDVGVASASSGKVVRVDAYRILSYLCERDV